MPSEIYIFTLHRHFAVDKQSGNSFSFLSLYETLYFCIQVIMEQSQDSSLHQQFQALQEQQKKKLMKRKQKQEDKIKEQNTKNEEVNGLGVPDNMDLKVSGI